MLKVGAIGGVIGLRYVLVRRDRARREAEAHEQPQVQAPRRDPHPVSRKKKRRRR